MCPKVRSERRCIEVSPQHAPRLPRGQVAELKHFKLPQMGRPLRSWKVNTQVRWPELPSRCPPEAPSLGEAPCQQPPHTHSLFPPKTLPLPKGVQCPKGPLGSWGQAVSQVLPKLLFPRTKSEPNSRDLIGKRQRRPPRVDTTSPRRRNRSPQMPRQR